MMRESIQFPSITKLLSKYWFLVLLIPFIFIIFSKITTVFIVGFMIISAVLVSLYRHLIPFNLGLELVTFYTVILALSISPLVAWVVAIVIILVSHLVTHNFCMFIGVKIAVYGVLAYVAWMMGGFGLFFVGVFLAVLKNVIFEGITFLRNPARGAMDLPSSVINVMINVWLFSMFGALILGAL
jgi:hypothetical protein